MKKTTTLIIALGALAFASGCADKGRDASTTGDDSSMQSGETTASNPLLAPWSGDYGGVPAFDRMELADLEPAFDAAMAENLAEIEAITANTDAATFENTIVAMERAGDAMSRVGTYFGIWSANRSSPEFRAVQAKVAPKLAAHRTSIVQNEALFRRVAAVHEAAQADDGGGLRPDQQRVVELVHRRFASNGAALEGEAKARYAEIQNALAELHTRFAKNVLGDEEAYVLFLNKDQLGGLSDSLVAAAAAAAAARDKPDQYAITNTRSSMDPFLTFSTERDLREKVWRTYYSRGDNGDDNDNNAIIAQILQLRDERVKLQGYDNYAQWRLEDRMAKAPERAMNLLEAVWPAALARVEEEVAAMQAIADAEAKASGSDRITIKPWDYRHYAEKVRRARYDLDSDEVKQYLQLGKLRDAMFYVAGELFGFAFAPVPEGSVPTFHPDVSVYEVTNKASGDHIGLWYLDPFAREGKRSGAWASTYRNHETFDGKKTVLVSNNSNFIQGAPGKPVLLSWSDAETYFHEFGHALHALSSRVAYPTLNSGVRDYTEFQSQLLERWLLTDPIIDGYLVHHETGERIPDELVAKVKKAATFNEGYSTTEYLASSLVDLAFHTTDPTDIDPDAFERETLERLGMPDEIVMRHRTPHFGHIFSGEGYSAGYYGYMWADVLTADAAEAFAESPGGFYDQEWAKKLVDHLFAIRNAVDPADAYRAFRGRDAGIEPLMRARGFPVPDNG